MSDKNIKNGQINLSDLDSLRKCGLSQLESIAVLHIINQKNKLSKPDYVFHIGK